MLQILAIILFFNFTVVFSTGNPGSKSSCIYKAVGEKVIIQMDKEKLQAESHVTWTHNQKRVYVQRGMKVTVKELDIDHTGSLILENIRLDQSGEYMGEVFNSNGKFLKKNESQLCVQEPVAEPTVIFKCEENRVTLTCNGMNHSEVVVSWIKNGKNESIMANAVLHVNSSDLKAGDKFSCTVRNMISVKSAKDVQPLCSDSGQHPMNDNKEKEVKSDKGNKKDDVSEKTFLFGLDFWWMLMVLTGGGTFLLILLLICIVCLCRCCKQSEKLAKEEQEFRLISLMPDQPDCQYNQETASQRPSKSQRPLPPIPGPRRPPSDAPSYI
ncbi:T-cell surface antigen CD2 [Myxocyprinus asiaticus]|uniref:T-cell surface antigen CD2 n=1 Tax=Myxocyprinus asiaticus TaxID=70543 RepID=UPI0022231B1B|nr:T-cell surface antigen CD2 [Myxocyprinus asiaticus]